MEEQTGHADAWSVFAGSIRGRRMPPRGCAKGQTAQEGKDPEDVPMYRNGRICIPYY